MEWTPVWHRCWLYVIVGVIALMLVLPSLIVVPMSFPASSLLQFPPKSYSLR